MPITTPLGTIDLAAFARDHVAEITGTVGLVTYAQLRKKLTPGGIVAGVVVALVHMLHPWKTFFWLLFVFFLIGTLVTRIGHRAKVHLTQSAAGGSGGEGARTATQVFANSGFAVILILLHTWLLYSTPVISSHLAPTTPISAPDFPALRTLLPLGIIAQYAAVAADTCSSELGILAKTTPFLITAPWRRVPRGTNGGVTIDGLLYGFLGGALLVGAAALTLRLSTAVPPPPQLDLATAGLLSAAGLAGSILDSLLGALVQVTVTDAKTGKVVEGEGGVRVLVAPGGGRLQRGTDLLSNNGVNFVMAALTSVGAMGAAHVLELGIGAK